MKIFLILIIQICTCFASEIWHAHENKQLPSEEMLKKNLSFILTEYRSDLGQSVMKMSQINSRDIYEYFYLNPDYRVRIGESNFRSFERFMDHMQILSSEKPNPNYIYNANIDALIRTSFYFKKMREDSESEVCSDISAPGQLQVAIHGEKASQIYDIAVKVCSGDLKSLKLPIDSLPQSWIDFASKKITGKSCVEVVQNDILEIISPYNNPLSSSHTGGTLEGTSIFLVKKLIPNIYYKDSALFKSLLSLSNIKNLDPSKNLYDSLKEKTSLSGVELIRLINLANHNHGLEYFMIKAIIDLSTNETQAIQDVNDAYNSLNHLYFLIQNHQSERKKYSSLDEDQFDRPYHYWGGAFVACELIQKGYKKNLSRFISKKLGEAYEINSPTSEKSEAGKKASQNDIKLHDLGASFAAENCQ